MSAPQQYLTFPVHVMLRVSPPTSILTCQFPDPVMKNIRSVTETQLFMTKDAMESKNLRSKFSVVRQQGSALEIPENARPSKRRWGKNQSSQVGIAKSKVSIIFC